VDYINDPLVGYISDRTRSRWERRRPFLLFGFLPYAILFAMLWWIPPFESQVWLAVYYGAVYALYDTAATIWIYGMIRPTAIRMAKIDMREVEKLVFTA